VIKYQCSGWLKYKKGSSDLRGFTYTYDASGNITKIVTEGTNVPQAALTKEYTYDALGQLATEVNGSGTTFGYAYDTAGNIRNITKDGTVTKSFGYTNPSWPDLLTSVTSGSTTKDILYEGQSQTSDLPSSGNPVTYYNGRDYTFTWTKGRQLASATVDGKQISYTYDMSGVRSNKQVGDTTYTYTTLSGKVMRQTWGDNNALEVVYDDGNQPFAVIYNDGSTSTLYYYVLNAQGDVAAILNSSGKLAASYDYDAWGNCTVYDSSAKVLTDPTSIANLNPLRYRGYYYDAETGFYYLQSRYYDPAICRFINADTFATTDANGLLSANMFAYCENNPIGNSDPDGYFAAALTGGGYLSGILVAGGANFWNPAGWIVVGITVAVAVGAGFYYYSEHSKRNGSDKRTKDKHQKGNARRQRDQGGEKKKQKSGWKSRR
jgi:RHS repeat-associated protein